MASSGGMTSDPGNEAQHPGPAAPQSGAHAPVADWANTPEVVLARVLQLLPVWDRQNAAGVCTAWQTACSHPRAWRHFDYGVLPAGGKQGEEKRVLDQLRARHQQYLDIIDTYGSKFCSVRMVLFCPEAFDVLERLTARCRDLKMCVLHVHGTGQLSDRYRRLLTLFLAANTGMEEARLKNVDFSAGNERNSPFPLGPSHTRSLRRLSLVNSFRQNNLSALMYLIRLQELTLMPHQLRFTWLQHLAGAALHTLNIVNMVGLWKFDFHVLPEQSWKRIAEAGPLRVNCYFMDLHNCSRLLCAGLPLASLVCCEYFHLKLKPLQPVITRYADTLTTFVYYSQSEMSYRCRPLAVDDHVLTIVQTCRQLRTLAVKDSLHSSTLLLMVQLGPSLRDPVVREDMVLYQLHVPHTLSLSQQVREFTERNFPADRFVDAMCHLLQREWRPLPPKEYFALLKARYTSW